MNGVMETNWSEWRVAVLCFSDVFLWLRGEHITLQLNEISGLLLSFDSIGKRQMKLTPRCFSKHLNSPSVSIKFKILMQFIGSFFPFFLSGSFVQRKCYMLLSSCRNQPFSNDHRRGKSCVYNYVVWKASGLTHLLDEVIKTNMMD